MSDRPLTGAEIRDLLREVAETLPRGPRVTIVVVGGSLLAVHGLRESTVDTDTVSEMTEALTAAVATVATAHDLPVSWLNNRAAAFAPRGLTEADCSTILDHPRLLVLGAPLRAVFVMKLLAYREPDRDDLRRMWSRAGFDSPAAAAAAFEDAYPHLEHDPFLVDLITALTAAGG